MKKTSYIAAGYVVDAKLPKVKKEALDKLTHMNIAFGYVIEDAISIAHLQNASVLTTIKQSHPDLQLILSVGGWGAGGFSEAASTEAGRIKMAESAVRILDELPLDGIDLDWEYPCYGVADIHSSPADKQNFTSLLKTIREALNRKGAADGRYYLLTIATGADQYYIDGTEMDKIEQYLDFIQLMTYDMRGGFQVLTGHHTNLFNSTGDLFRISTDASVRMFMDAGVPREKIVVGAAFYSRMWNQVPDRNNGLHQMAGTTGGYGPEYSTLVAEYINKNGYVRHWDDEAKAPYLFNGSSFISYDDEQSFAHKCSYIKEHQLGGMMFWEYGCDDTLQLLNAMYEGLKLD
ncbi:glycoside hydrolase family 18 protein [Paenibacillus sp. N1-5-1-14]|uniref:glycoside hydrolase family 18 protein n=1 Tax=Paenibacillus radicibacter TaxID=2972488 RepID=UPI002158ACD6|nr:glycoside hydrolase family 18 protein [Paenibacillus radicibacter]MCR8641128.1 glycoside hydrolase family 18 protein [Paenibacillus radicibacter]